METPNAASLTKSWRQLGAGDQEILRLFRSYNASAEPFQTAGEAHEKKDH
jgi:hypothetical protein